MLAPLRGRVRSLLLFERCARLHSTSPACESLQEPGRDSLASVLSAQIEEIKAAGTYKQERVITTPQSTSVHVNGRPGDVINFCANNYLGLANHPALVSAARKSLDTHGFGLASVRFICGTQDIHTQLERTLSRFHQTDDTILYPSCFDANAGLFEAILGPEDAIISDQLNHASIIDGVRLCKAQRFRYTHMDMADLDAKLQEAQHARVKLIATDGVFSMDGDIAPLKEICDLADKHSAIVFVDDCHASGFMGATGRGTDEHCGVMGRVGIINSTLGKALGGGTGGYTTGRGDVVEMLRQKARPYLFSNSVSPAVVGASLAALHLLSSSTELRDKLEQNAKRFRKEMTEAGFEIRPGTHPIVPIMLGDARLANEMAKRMLDRGVYVVGFSFPVVPKSLARIRVQLSAAHTEQQLTTAIAAFKEVGKELGVI